MMLRLTAADATLAACRTPPCLTAAAVAVIAAAIAVVVAVGLKVLRSFRELGTDAERATYKTLHAASRAGQHLRTGLNPAGAAKASRQLRGLLGCDALAITDTAGVLAWDGAGRGTQAAADGPRRQGADGGRTAVIPAGELQLLAGRRAPSPAPHGLERAVMIAPITGRHTGGGRGGRLRPRGRRRAGPGHQRSGRLGGRRRWSWPSWTRRARC